MNTNSSCAAIALVALLWAVSGCTQDTGPYPSLLPRPIEKISLAEPAPAPAATAAPDPRLDARIASWRSAVDQQRQAFDAAAARAAAATRAAHGAAAGSEPWLTAQAAIAELDNLRADTQALISDANQAAIARAAALQPAYPALDALRQSAGQLAEAQSARITDLSGQLTPA